MTVRCRNPECGRSAVICTEIVDLPEIGGTLSFGTIDHDTPLSRRLGVSHETPGHCRRSLWRRRRSGSFVRCPYSFCMT
ncbi:hypothetical protein LRS73_25845 [Methylobacterium currus]|uniref:hypothetical protein n=1 Tax=Methylobacterium currus TaxID=2051553 RepID=UPI001E4F0F90|nr:hypothetical protein [Methylobacterium currus]UHC15870.1 hypothetical protein LRS73_25845 [Methylobacterium currus]